MNIFKHAKENATKALGSGTVRRFCDNCQQPYTADSRNLNRGWGLCCSKSCASSKREHDKVEKRKAKEVFKAVVAKFGL